MKDGRERPYVGEEILQALGRQPNIEGLRLDSAGVTVDGGRIVVDGAMRTSQAHIYAVGDVNDVTPIVHLAIQQGEIAAYNATHPGGPVKELDHRLDAEVVFTDPQVAVLGLNETRAKAEKIPYSRDFLSFCRSWESTLSWHVAGICEAARGSSDWSDSWRADRRPRSG
jgi:pyruvate/2-oxoglutarate dehydrogenase complex dihydrolipoamide dehydrogenase (E3) component